MTEEELLSTLDFTHTQRCEVDSHGATGVMKYFHDDGPAKFYHRKKCRCEDTGLYVCATASQKLIQHFPKVGQCIDCGKIGTLEDILEIIEL